MLNVRYIVKCRKCNIEWVEGGEIPHPTLHAGYDWCECDCGGKVIIKKVEEEVI